MLDWKIEYVRETMRKIERETIRRLILQQLPQEWGKPEIAEYMAGRILASAGRNQYPPRREEA